MTLSQSIAVWTNLTYRKNKIRFRHASNGNRKAADCCWTTQVERTEGSGALRARSRWERCSKATRVALRWPIPMPNSEQQEAVLIQSLPSSAL